MTVDMVNSSATMNGTAATGSVMKSTADKSGLSKSSLSDTTPTLKGQVGPQSEPVSEKEFSLQCRKLFTPEPGVLDLPYRQPVAENDDTVTEYKEERVLAPKELLSALQVRSKALGRSLESTLLAAYHVLLWRYTGVEDFVMACLHAPHHFSMLRPSLNPNAALEDVLKAVELAMDSGTSSGANMGPKELQAVLAEHEMLAPEALVSIGYADSVWQVPARWASRSEARASPQEVLRALLPSGQTSWALHLTITQQGSLDGCLTYDAKRFFLQGEAELVMGHYVQILKLIAGSCDAPVSRISFLQEKEHKLVQKCNDTKRAIPPGGVHQLFEKQAKACPDAVALEFTDAPGMTYAEMDARANRLANHLHSMGVGAGSLVGVFLERTPDLPVSLLAVLKCGAAYVPLDPLYPKDRITMMLEDAAAAVVITTSDLAESLHLPEKVQPRLLQLDAPEEAAALAAASPTSRPNGGDVAQAAAHRMYVIFTSGSTGRPKGVQICHQSMVNFLASFQETLGVGSKDALVAVTTVCFDIAGLELFLPLVSGARCVLARRDEAGCPMQLAALLHKSQATILQATPATWRMLVRSGWSGQSNSSLRGLCGGEPLPPSLRDELVPLVHELWNVYGPTETTVWSTMACLARAGVAQFPGTIVPIGKPVANTSVYVLDRNRNLMPLGLPGELWIGGKGLSLGYLGLPELSKEKFVACPFESPEGGDDAPALMYATGDLVRWDTETGMLQCLGRLDNQVKIRGFRIELGEIETNLSHQPGVTQAVVEARVDPNSDGTEKRLVAFLVMEEPEEEEAPQEPAADEELGVEESEDSPVKKSGKVDKVASSQKDLEEIASWGAIYDSAYASQNAINSDPTLNFSGYDNSFTPRIPHELHVVREWVERTCERVMALQPRRALELGCGNGMIMLRCALGCERYVACDLSEQAVDYCNQVITTPQFRKLADENIVTTALGGAHESERFKHEVLDTIVCNGVSMYFPSAAYLLEVVQTALAALQPGGKFFLGDVRCNSVLNHFHAACQLYQAPEHLPVSELLVRTTKSIKFEKELLVDPELFLLLAGRLEGMATMELDMKRGEFHSEFSMFRYDVTFTKTDPSKPLPPPVEYPMEAFHPEKHSLEALGAAMAAGKQEVFAVTGFSDARLAMLDVLMNKISEGTVESETAGALLREVTEGAVATIPVEPEDVYRLGEKHDYKVELFWQPGKPAHFDALFISNQAKGLGYVEPIALASARRHFGTISEAVVVPQEVLEQDYEMYTNRGKLAKYGVDLNDGRKPLTAQQVTELRDVLRHALPDYMIPSAFVGLTRMPQTNNGKVDRKALPEPNSEDMAATVLRTQHLVEPEGPTEIALLKIWKELLGLPVISATDDFFELGGHSLMAMQMLGKIRAEVAVTVSLTQLIRVSVLRDLAKFIDQRASAATSATASSGVQLDDTPPAVKIVDAQSLPYSVGVVPHVAVDMRDGVRLAGRAWIPLMANAASGSAPPSSPPRFPALLDVLPYRKADGTVEVDSATFPYLAGHGFACVRLDNRGSGDSEGHLDDEYSSQGLQDLNDAVEWAAQQAWCDGQVVLLGCSWGGIAALQAAASPPPSLKGVIAVCATEDRFADDMHFMGGSLLNANLSWGTWMLHTVAQPPSLAVDIEGKPFASREAWRDSWLSRLEGLHPPHSKWLNRPSADMDYWSNNSLKMVPGGAPRVPVLAVGGAAAGGYVNSVPRLSAAASKVRIAPVKAIVGPWAHQFPHLSPIGPQFGFLQEVVEWMNDRVVNKLPVAKGAAQFLVHATKTISPAEEAMGQVPPGVWLGMEDAVHAEHVCPGETLAFHADGSLSADAANGDEALLQLPESCQATAVKLAAGECDVHPAGRAGGAWFTFSGTPEDLPGDQAADDAVSLCFDGPALEHDTLVLGSPEVKLALRSQEDEVKGNLVARLCAVGPTGESVRVSYGVVNLTAGRWGKEARVAVALSFAARVVPAGHKLRLALSRDYWPIVCPQPGVAPLQVLLGKGAGGGVQLPLAAMTSAEVALAAERALPLVHGEVHLATAEQASVTRPGSTSQTVGYDHQANALKVVRSEDRGTKKLDSRSGTVVDVTTREEYSLGKHEGKTSAGAMHKVEWQSLLEQPVPSAPALKAHTQVESSMVGHNDHFELRTRVRAVDCGKLLFEREWVDTVPRSQV